MNRNRMIDYLKFSPDIYDIIVIGGGATGLGTALDAAQRGYKTLLLEQSDFAKGTSSRSTKLIHGGLRYLKQGNIHLVKEALTERGIIFKNAPHLVQPIAFMLPIYKWWETPFYMSGLKIYDLLAGSSSFQKSKRISKEEVHEKFPTLEFKNLKGGIVYYDGQFDDTRLAICLAQTCVDLDAVVVNYCKVTSLIKKNHKVCGVIAHDEIDKQEFRLHSKVVINATGIFSDQIRKMDNEASLEMITPSQGVHLVLDKSFLPSNMSMIIPQTKDNRVLFMVPWHNRILVGTTDTKIEAPLLEPVAFKKEVSFLLEHISKYLTKKPTEKDILSVFAGIRPLVKKSDKKTAALSRNHVITVSDSNLITISGGKWTTYRKMAEDVVNKAMEVASLKPMPCQTRQTKLHGFQENIQGIDSWDFYGSDKDAITRMIHENPELGIPLHPDLPYLTAEVIWAIRHEMAQTVEDFLSRRSRALLLDARASIKIAAKVAELMANELGKDKQWINNQVENFTALAKNYFID